MTSAILVAAGKGIRMGMDKLWAEVLGRPVLAHSWLAFDRAPTVDQVVLVVRSEQEKEVERLGRGLMLQKPFRLIAGGGERQDSVWNGLEAVPAGTQWVAIHDAARPCVTQELISETLAAAREAGAAVAAQPLTDTVKESADGVSISAHLDRSRLWSVQTPQCFRFEVIQRAMRAVREQGLAVTDDTAACALIGQEVRLVKTQAANPKVTVPADLGWVEWLLSRRSG